MRWPLQWSHCFVFEFEFEFALRNEAFEGIQVVVVHAGGEKRGDHFLVVPFSLCCFGLRWLARTGGGPSANESPDAHERELGLGPLTGYRSKASFEHESRKFS